MTTPQASLFPTDPLPAVPDLGRLVTAKGFQEIVKSGSAAADGVAVAKDFADTSVSKESNGFRFTLTSGSVDRENDVIEPEGLDWEPFERNPIVLHSHDAQGVHPWPAMIGVVSELKQLKTRTDILVKFTPPEVNPLGESIRQMISWRIDEKALKDSGGMTSIGLMPTEFSFDRQRGGVNFIKAEPLEASIVAIGANRDALRRMKSAGLDLDPVAEWAEAYRKIDGPDQGVAVAVIRALDSAKGPAFLLKIPEVKGMGTDLGLREMLSRSVDAANVAAKTVTAPAPDVGPDPAELLPILARVAVALEKLEAAPVEKITEPEPPPGPTPELVMTRRQFQREAYEIDNAAWIAETGRPLPFPEEFET